MNKLSIEPPFGLKEEILNRIRYEQRLSAAKRRIFVFSIGLIISVFTFIPALKLLIDELNRTKFIEFFSLLSSDLSLVIKYWQSFGLSLLESLPVLGLMAFFGVILLLLASLRYLSKNIIEIKFHPVK